MKVKINRVRNGSTTGDQSQYGLVTGSIWNYENKSSTNNVDSTISAVPRDEATIEAERGETVVGDLDGDGMVEHAKIGGKRHAQGGTPLNVPDGSFVYSDYRGLLIKNTDVLKNIFNIKASKSMTPAQVAKKFDLDKYKQILEDPLADPLDKKTAQLMLDNNMKKLGQLALVQEGMKGFPDGIPDIALPLMGSDMGQSSQPQQEPGMAKYGGQPKMKKGGLIKYQSKGNVDREHINNVVKLFNAAKNRWLNTQPGTKEQREAAQVVQNILTANKELFQRNKFPASLSEMFTKDWSPQHNDAVHDLVVKKAEQAAAKKQKDIKAGYTLPSEDEYVKRKQVSEAQEKFYKALASGNSDEMRKTSEDLDQNFDISGLSTPLGTLGQIFRNTGEFVSQAGVDLLSNMVGVTPTNLDFSSTSPWGATWQEKVNDMRDILSREARRIDAEKKYKQDNITRTNTITSNLAKLNALRQKAKAIVSNPKAYDSKYLQMAANALDDLSDASVDKDLSVDWGGWSGIPQKLDKHYHNLSKLDKTPEITTPTNIFEVTDSSLIDQSPINQIPADNVIHVNTTTGERVNPDGTPKQSVVPAARPKEYTDRDVLNYIYEASGDTSNPSITQEQIEQTRKEMKQSDMKKLGGGLQKFQGKEKSTVYDMRFKPAVTAASNSGFEPSYNYWKHGNVNNTIVGSQGTKTHVKSPNNIWYTKGDTAPDINQFETYELIEGDPSTRVNFNDYEGGFSQWKKDQDANTNLISTPATKFWINQINKMHRDKFGVDMYDTQVADVFEPGKQWSTPLSYKKITKQAQPTIGQDQPPTESTDLTDIPSDIKYEQGIDRSPWYRQDVANYYNTLNNYANVRRPGDPSLYQLNPYMPDPTFVDPARAIAQQQGALRAAQEAIMSSSDPSVGRANVIASQAAGADPIANIMSAYDERNVGIANQFGVNKAQVFNNTLAKNAELRKGYQDEREVAAQQYANALKDARDAVTGAYMQGETNRDVATSANVQNPNYRFDPSTGTYYFKKGYDLKTGNYLGQGSDNYGATYESLKKKYGETAALKILELMVKGKTGIPAMPADIYGQQSV